jgi:redox-sensitive bicupin YhaK (pirin superfamily)
MTNARQIDAIYAASPPHWVGDGFRVRGYFSAIRDAQRKLSPFLLLDYHAPHDYAPTTNPRRGVGPHPHRGFETVTLAFQGSVAHHDSAGNGGVIGPGDVQWMTAGSGILHREYHEEQFARRGGTMHMAQIWVNLPRAHKLEAPRYQTLPAEGMGQVALPDEAGLVRVIAGQYAGTRGPAKTFTPVTMLDVRLNAGGRFEHALPARHNAALLVMKGELAIDEQARATSESLVLFAHEGERIALQARSAAHLLVLAGEPIDEPVVAYGPFVMNSEREIEQAITDFERGRFGHLDE